MSMKPRSLIFIVLLAVFISGMMANTARGEMRKEVTGVFGVVGGIIGAGTFNLDRNSFHSEWKTGTSYSIGIFLNIPVRHKLHASAAIDIHNVKLSIYDWFQSPQLREDMIEASLGLKLKLVSRSGKFIFWPGAAIGAGALKEIGGIDDSKYLTVKVTTELTAMLGRRFGLISQLGLIWAPLGGDGIYDVTGGPILLMRGGIAF